MKSKIVLVLVILFVLNSCKRESEYQKLSHLFSSDEFINIPKEITKNGKLGLYEDIISNEKYNFWQIREMNSAHSSYEIIKEYGTLKNDRTTLDSIDMNGGFFYECLPGFCYTYILAQNEEKIDTIDSVRKLRQFIGRIDNLSEALLIAKTYDYWVDHNNKEGSSYLETDNEYLLKILNFESTPHTWYSVRSIIDKKSGNFIMVDQMKYKSEKIWSIN